jgi:predicted RNase H-like HicB family nuclease
MAMAVSLREYVREILNTAEYRSCEDGPGFVGIVGVLPGCMTQGGTFEDTRELLIDAIETWILSALKEGQLLPVVNGRGLAIAESAVEPEAACG